jgi:hypothetical protein
MSNYIKEEFGLSEKFLTGAVLPDILKISYTTRNESHYIKEVNERGRYFNLPDIERYVIENQDLYYNDLKLGYFAHLIQDRIWFKYFIPKFSDYDPTKQIIKYRNGAVRGYKEYLKDVYSDYSILDRYIIEEIGFKYDKNFKNIISKNMPDEKLKELFEENSFLRKIETDKLILISKDDFESYLHVAINISCNMVKNMIIKRDENIRIKA